jgi:hypothetical protein
MVRVDILALLRHCCVMALTASTIKSSSWLDTFSNALGASTVSNAQTAAVKPKKKNSKLVAPELAVPEWMTKPPTLPEINIEMPEVPVPDPLAQMSVSSGEEQRLRRRRRGILASQGGAGNSGGWMP